MSNDKIREAVSELVKEFLKTEQGKQFAYDLYGDLRARNAQKAGAK